MNGYEEIRTDHRRLPAGTPLVEDWRFVMNDTHAINAIIKILWETVIIFEQHEPLASMMPAVASLVSQVDELKKARNLP